MASHFEDFCELQTFEAHRPSSFFEVLYLCRLVIFLVALAVSAARAQFSLIVARFRRAMFFWGLVLATEVALSCW